MPTAARKRSSSDEDEDIFEKRSKEAARDLKNKQDRGMFKLSEGRNVVRILRTPPDEERGTPPLYMEYYIHRNVGPKNRFLRCGKRVEDETGKCWLCDDIIAQLKERGKDAKAEELARSKQYVIKVATFDEDEQELRGPLLWMMRSGKSNKAIASRVQRLVSNPKYTKHKGGYNFIVTRVGKSLNDTVYEIEGRDEETSDVPKAILSKLTPFSETIYAYDPEAQKRAYYGRENEEDDEEEPKSKKRTRDDEEEEEDDRPRRKIRPRVEEEEEDEEEPKPRSAKKKPSYDEDEDEDEQDEEEERPKSKKASYDEDEDEDEDEEEERPKSKSKRKVEEEDEDEDDADEDEEEDRPKKTSKKIRKDEDEDEEDADDDDDEDRPKKPSRKKTDRDDDDEDEVEDEDEAEERPKKPAKKTARRRDDDDED